jgi:hypothetical protein
LLNLIGLAESTPRTGSNWAGLLGFGCWSPAEELDWSSQMDWFGLSWLKQRSGFAGCVDRLDSPTGSLHPSAELLVALGDPTPGEITRVSLSS